MVPSLADSRLAFQSIDPVPVLLYTLLVAVSITSLLAEWISNDPVIINDPVVRNEPVTSVLLLIDTTVPVSVIFELVICSPKSPACPLVNLLAVIVISFQILLKVCGHIFIRELVEGADGALWCTYSNYPNNGKNRIKKQ